MLPAEFTGVELSPVAPLGTCAAVASVSQNRIVTTARNTEVVSDSTNALAVAAMIARHLTYWLDVLAALIPHREPRVELTALRNWATAGSPPGRPS